MTTVIAPLGNIESCGIDIDDWLSLTATPDHMAQLIQQGRNSLLIRDPGQFPHCLVLRGQRLDKGNPRDLVERAVLLLRLFKPGNLYYNFVLRDEAGWFADPTQQVEDKLWADSVFFFQGWDHPGLEGRYSVTEGEALALQQFVAKHWDNQVLSRRFFHLFFRGYHEPYAEDRFLRNAVALENIFVNESQDQSNVTYKFVDRGCYLLQLARPLDQGAGGYAKSLGLIYKTRSALVHTNEKPRDWTGEPHKELMVTSDRYLRLCLRLILEDPTLGSSTEIDKRKRAEYGIWPVQAKTA